MGFVLDIVFRDAAINRAFGSIVGPVWLAVGADGLNLPFHTDPVSVASGPRWNFAVRLVLSVADVAGAYLYCTLCTYGPGGHGTVALGRSRIGLRSLPTEEPKTFSFALMAAQSSAQEMARLSVCATLSPIQKYATVGGERTRKAENDRRMQSSPSAGTWGM
jgi:hypothetical protein